MERVSLPLPNPIKPRECAPLHACVSIVAGVLLAASCAPRSQPARGVSAGTRVNPDAAAMADFAERVDAYVALHRDLEAKMPPLATDATPEQIEKHQGGLAEQIRRARLSAKPGDIFTQPVREQLRVIIGRNLNGPNGAAARQAIMHPDSNPGEINHRVNAIYPDAAPVSTVPPRLLLDLPRLPDEVEFRFVGRDLILRDTHANIVIDFVRGAIQ
jgi:hypothetical protein